MIHFQPQTQSLIDYRPSMVYRLTNLQSRQAANTPLKCPFRQLRCLILPNCTFLVCSPHCMPILSAKHTLANYITYPWHDLQWFTRPQQFLSNKNKTIYKKGRMYMLQYNTRFYHVFASCSCLALEVSGSI